jgi:hypothetical protein
MSNSRHIAAALEGVTATQAADRQRPAYVRPTSPQRLGWAPRRVTWLSSRGEALRPALARLVAVPAECPQNKTDTRRRSAPTK